MGRETLRRETLGALFVLAAGTLLHFTYGWSGKNLLAAAFSAVNESVWEHMKLVAMPLFLLTMGEVWFRDEPNLLAARGAAALTGTGLIPVLFYTYSGIAGAHALWADIAVFVLAVAGAFLLEWKLLGRGRSAAGWQQAAGLAVVWLLAILFVLWTYRPPDVAVFRDPRTGLLGPG